MGNEKIRVRLWDKMVLVGIGLGAMYWIIESVLRAFQSSGGSFLGIFFGPDLPGLSTRIVVMCLFLIYGSHAQYTLYVKEQIEAELADMKDHIKKLEGELAQVKKA